MHALKLNATIDRRRFQLELPADTPEGTAEVIVLLNSETRVGQSHEQEPQRPPQTDASHSEQTLAQQLFAAIDAMPRRRLTKAEIDRYISNVPPPVALLSSPLRTNPESC